MVDSTTYVYGADGLVLGRLASTVASLLLKSTRAGNSDQVVIVNAEKVAVTGNKAKGKIYYSHTGYPGGIKDISFEKLIDKAPERVIQSAVKGMLPRGPLGREMFRKLKVYAGVDHPHAAQQPQTLEL